MSAALRHPAGGRAALHAQDCVKPEKQIAMQPLPQACGQGEQADWHVCMQALPPAFDAPDFGDVLPLTCASAVQQEVQSMQGRLWHLGAAEG